LEAVCGQPLREAGEAEVRRLRVVSEEVTGGQAARVDADLRLLKATPETELLLRYEAAAERELHRAVATLLKLREHPELVSPPEPVAVEGPAPEPSGSAKKVGSRQPSRRTMPPARNEATGCERLNPDPGPRTARAGSLAPENRRL
jgi:hypothetical protein